MTRIAHRTTPRLGRVVVACLKMCAGQADRESRVAADARARRARIVKPDKRADTPAAQRLQAVLTMWATEGAATL
jgi:hypothetical protein